MEYSSHYRSPLGMMTLASDGSFLTGLWFDGQKHFGGADFPELQISDLPVFEQTGTWLDTYFSGKEPGFMPEIILKTTAFRKAVYQILLTIPYGETMTYGEIAKRLAGENGGKPASARAVGGAVGHNPISLIVPCHRVTGTNGKLTGYAGGIDKKAALLALERAVSGNMIFGKTDISGDPARDFPVIPGN